MNRELKKSLKKVLTKLKRRDKINELFSGNRSNCQTYHEKTLKKLKKALDKRVSNVIE